jgi:uncharacterized iron-regulated membrane protein
MTVRQFLLVTHRWLGLASALFIAIVAVSGALLLIPAPRLVTKIAGRLHTQMGVGPQGAWIVDIATVLAILLQLGGAVLWWKRKTIRVRTRAGLTAFAADLHHTTGALGLPITLFLAATGLWFATVNEAAQPVLSHTIERIHSSRGWPTLVNALYVVGALCLFVQCAAGVIMWWKPAPRVLKVQD